MIQRSWGVGVMVLGLPLLTWWQAGAPHPNIAIAQTPRLLFLALGLLAITWHACQDDPWMFCWVAYLLGLSFFTKVPGAWDTMVYVVLGVVVMQAARAMPDHWRRWASWGIGGIGLLETALAASQRMGYDPIWRGEISGGAAWVHGTLGNPNHLGAYLALAAGVAPIWMLPFLAAGVVVSQSILAAGALMVALYVRGKGWRIPLLLVGAAVVAGMLVWRPESGFGSWIERWEAWKLAVYAWSFTPWTGNGPGSWATLGPLAQLSVFGVATHRFTELFGTLHNEPLQHLFEGGLVGVGLAGGWLWTHRRALGTSPVAPSLAALAVVSLASFPFHVVSVAALACVLLGWSLQREERQ